MHTYAQWCSLYFCAFACWCSSKRWMYPCSAAGGKRCEVARMNELGDATRIMLLISRAHCGDKVEALYMLWECYYPLLLVSRGGKGVRDHCSSGLGYFSLCACCLRAGALSFMVLSHLRMCRGFKRLTGHCGFGQGRMACTCSCVCMLLTYLAVLLLVECV
jgi:hypothetical protein